ncbi:MAG: RNA polymerase sigma factor [Planctomycetota bacterium]|jgi:RNA polymerase sigma-70 factor (ECF subfamily)
MTGKQQELPATMFCAPKPGDHAGFERVMLEHTEFLQRAIHSKMDARLRSVLEPDDVMQDVMIAAYRSIGDADFPSAQAFRRWLGVLVQNRLVDLARRYFGTKRRCGTTTSLDETAGPGDSGAPVRARERVPSYDPSPSSIATRREAAEALEHVLACIPPHYRQIIRLVQIERLSTREIAARMGKKPEAVRKCLSRALEACRKAMLRKAPQNEEAAR